MNRFRSRKKSQDGGESALRTSSDDVPAIPSTRNRTFRRKKVQPEPKFELDLSTALPSSDNFRTSLLMPNLSARFSMLRDQDNPNTKIGKANDDSVLFPKRASRLNLFGCDGLSDIAEVSSLSHSIRPPFAYDRTASYSSTDGYGTDDDASQGGSVMSRSKPGQGNKFFGGRQKIYKIPLGTSTISKDSTTSGDTPDSRKGMGKAVYDDDVAVSAFQALRDREREGKSPREEDDLDPYNDRPSTDRQGSPPPFGYNQNRETASSTTSGPFNTRISTAATSVASSMYGTTQTSANSPVQTTSGMKQSPIAAAGPDRATNKTKRMYGQGLDQHMYEQQFSAVHRLESLQQRRGPNGAPLPRRVSQSRSASNLNERFQRTGPLYASNNFRAGSPPPSAKASGSSGFDLGLGAEKRAIAGRDEDPGFGRSPSLSPPMSPGPESTTFAASLEPNDVGKATASGAFHKPRAQYNEQQYAQRQMQLHEGRETPPLRAPSSTDTYSERSGRLRNDSFTSNQSTQTSKVHLMGSSTNDQPLGLLSENISSRVRPVPFDPYQKTAGTFLAGFSGDESSQGESEHERSDSPDLQTLQPTTYQSTSRAMGNASNPSNQMHDRQVQPCGNGDAYLKLDGVGAVVDKDGSSEEEPRTSSVENAAHLSGLIRTHLRNESGTSSVYPSTPPLEAEFPPDLPKHSIHFGQVGILGYRAAEADHKLIKGAEGSAQQANEAEDASAHAPLSLRARQILDQATQLRNGSPKAQKLLGAMGTDKAQKLLGGEAPHLSEDPSWKDQVKGHHMRGDSTETQREREEFANELADRRRRVQENLQNFADSESRSASPMTSRYRHDGSPSRAPGAFDLLKKVGKGSLAGRSDTPSKAMKMLGIGNSPYSTQGASSNAVDDHALRDANRNPQMLAHANGITQPSKIAAGSGPSFRDRSIGAECRAKFQAPKPSPPFASTERAGSPSGRVATHQQNQPTDQLRGTSNFAKPHRKNSPPGRFDPVVDRTVQPRSQSALSNRSRSNSRSTPAGYFDHKSLLMVQPAYQNSYPAAVGRAPRASPVAPYAAHTTPPLQDVSPVSATPTMVSGNAFPPAARASASRKRSVNKHDISEPTFINCTSSVTTIDLPPGASLSNGMDSPDISKPPLPPINPRRKRTPTAQNVFAAFSSRSTRDEGAPRQLPPSENFRTVPYPGTETGMSILQHTVIEQYEERSNFSADESEPKPKGRYRLRKSSSEGGNMAARARHQALMNSQSPAMPSTPILGSDEKVDMF